MTIAPDRPHFLGVLWPTALALLLSLTSAASAEEPAPSNSSSAALSSVSLYGRDITAVEFVGLRAVAESKALQASVLRKGSVYTREAEATTLAGLYRTGFFKGDIRIDARPDTDDSNGVIVTVTVAENPTIERLEIVGNSKLKTAAIEAGFSIKKGDVVPTNVETAAAESIRALYDKKGYSNVKVDVERRELTADAVALRIVIDEGTRIRIGDIDYTGNESVSAFRLNLRMATKGSLLFIDNYLDRSLFDTDLEVLKDYYYSIGFLDAEVREGASRYSADGESVDLVVAIDEGQRYTFEEVRFTGATLFTPGELREPFVGILGKHLDRARIGKALERIRQMYGDSGWILASIEPEYEKTDVGHGVVVTLAVEETQRIRVGSVRRTERALDVPENELGPLSRLFARIAPPVKDDVVLRHMKLSQGEVYRQREQEASLRELRGLRVFKSVKIEHEPTNDPGVRDVNVYTETGNTGFLLLQAGVGSGDGAFGRIQLTERNLFGEARAASIAATLGSRTQGLSASYLDRDFRQSNKAFLVNVFYNEYNRRGYDEDTIGTTLRLSYDIEDNLSEFWRLRLASVSIDPDEDVIADLDDYVLAAVGFGRTIDLRDDTRLPTKGYLAAGTIEGGVADAAFVKLSGRYEWHRELFGPLLYGLDLSGGVVPVPGDRDDLGIGERFFLGGANDLRGFRFRGAGPKDAGESDLALGGLTKILLRNEVTFPVGVDALRGLVFVDVGSLDEDAFALDSPRASAGFGLRYISNAVDAEIDFGFALADEGDDDTQVFHFLIESGI